MKQFRKFLCGVMLTSFVIIGSVSVFAAVPPSGSGGDSGGSTTKDCLQLVEMTAGTDKASEYRETQTHLGTISGEMGDSVNYGDPTPDPSPIDDDGDGEPEIIYRVVTNYNEDWVTDAYDCEEGVTADGVDLICTAESIMDDAPAQAVLDGAPSTKDDVIQRYGNCAEIDITVTYKYKYKYTVNNSCDCDLCSFPCFDSSPGHSHKYTCDTDHSEELESEVKETTRTYSSSVGKKIYGNSDYTDAQSHTIYTYTSAFSSEDAAIATIDAHAKDTALPEKYQNAKTASQHTIQLASSTRAIIDNTGTFDYNAYYVYNGDNGKALCSWMAREEIVGLIIQSLIDQGYYNVSSAANNYYLRNGCRTYALGYSMWNGTGGDSGSPAHQKLQQYYKNKDFFVKDNNNYAILFPFSSLIVHNTGQTALGIPTYEKIWDDNWNPMLVKFEEKVVYAEMATNGSGSPVYKDVVIGRDNGSVDVMIQNITNPESVYYNSQYFPLNASQPYAKFSSIRASFIGKRDTLVYPYPDGSGFGWKLNFGQSGEFTTTKESIQGTNRITGFSYGDIYKQRLFRIIEEKNLMGYAVGGNTIFTDGEYIGLRDEPEISGDSCNYKWRALFNVYAEEDEPMSTFSNDGIGMDASYMITNVGIFSTEDDGTAGMIIPVGATSFSYKGKQIRTSVRLLFLDKTDYETAFRDVLTKQRNLVQLYDANGNIRNAIFTDSRTAGKIKFENGTNEVDYSLVPSHIKPTKTNGTTSITEYSIDRNGIYVLAQSFLKEISSETIVSPYNTTTLGYTTDRTTIKYYICVGQHNCDCEDINVLCECQDEIAGCPKSDDCEDNPHLPECQPGIDCTENPSDPACGCFDNVRGNCNCPDYVDPETCELWIPAEEFDPDCLDKEGISCDEDPPGGITGEGSEEYFDRFYKPSSTITN